MMHKNNILKISHNGMTCLRFRGFEDFNSIGHAVFARDGGLSQEPYDSLNTSFGVGDDPEKVAGNRRKVQDTLQAAELVFCRQVHGTDVRVVTGRTASPVRKTKAQPPIADAMVTDQTGKFLVIQVADCQPILVYDPVRQVVANIHSGWRGSISNIIRQTINVMTETFGSSGKDLFAGVGPSLGPCCAEFINYRSEIPRLYWEYKLENSHFDFWALSRDQLLTAGLVREHIFSSNLCTRCRTDLFYSYRGEGKTGRFAAVIGLK